MSWIKRGEHEDRIGAVHLILLNSLTMVRYSEFCCSGVPLGLFKASENKQIGPDRK